MAHIIINPSLSAAIGYKKKFNPPKFAVVIAILEPANSTRTDNNTNFVNLEGKCYYFRYENWDLKNSLSACAF